MCFFKICIKSNTSTYGCVYKNVLVKFIAIKVHAKSNVASLAFKACNRELRCYADLISLYKKLLAPRTQLRYKMNFQNVLFVGFLQIGKSILYLVNWWQRIYQTAIYFGTVLLTKQL